MELSFSAEVRWIDATFHIHIVWIRDMTIAIPRAFVKAVAKFGLSFVVFFFSGCFFQDTTTTQQQQQQQQHKKKTWSKLPGNTTKSNAQLCINGPSLEGKAGEFL